MKLLLVGHACGPNLGSEPGFTWNWASELSKEHDITLLAYPEHRAAVESYLTEHPNPRLSIEWVVPQTRFDPWKPGQSDRWIRLHYILWLKEAYRKAVQLHRDYRYDLLHHVSWGTIGAAPRFAELPLPCVWGPLGGGQFTPPAFLACFGKDAWKEKLRNARVRLLGRSRGLRRAAGAAQLALATNRETEQVLRDAGASRTCLFLDGGLPSTLNAPWNARPDTLHGITLVWAGRLEHRKALPIALHALVEHRGRSFELLVAGDGPLRAEWEALARSLGLEGQVRFLGRVPYDETMKLFGRAHAFLFTSLRDSFGSVVLEAMAQGAPIITLDHQGVGAFVPASAGIKVPVTSPEETQSAFGKALGKVFDGTIDLNAASRAAWQYAQTETWAARASRMTELYDEVLRAHRGL